MEKFDIFIILCQKKVKGFKGFSQNNVLIASD